MPGTTELHFKPKRKSSEKRKAKSRDAARTRRSNEAEIFNDLTLEIPLALDVLAHCDKASLIRLAISAIKMKTFVNEVLNVDRFPGKASDSLFLPTLDGFLMVLTNEGDLIYVSENVFRMLGVAQADMLGQKVYDFIHPCDQDCVRSEISTTSEQDHVFFVRMRTSYNSKSHCFSVRAPDYKVVCCTGHSLVVKQSNKGSVATVERSNLSRAVSDCSSVASEDFCVDQSEKRINDNLLYTVIIGRLILEPEVNSQLRLDCCSFVTRHSPNMKCIYCDERVTVLLGYRPEDLIGRSLYDYHHPLDDELVKKAYKTLFTGGQMMIPSYRFMRRRGGYSWLETKAVVLGKPQRQQQQQQQASGREQDVLCIHCVISEPKCTRLLMSDVQQKCETPSSTLTSLLTRADEEPHQGLTLKIKPEKSEQLACDVDLCATDNDDVDDDVGCDDEDDDCMQFMTEEILGLTTSDSNTIFEKLLKPEFAVDDEMDDTYEMKAPYIPLDDMEFGSIIELKDNSVLDMKSSIKSLGQPCLPDLQDFLLNDLKHAGIAGPVNGNIVVGRLMEEREMSRDLERLEKDVEGQTMKESDSEKEMMTETTSDTQLVCDIINICSKTNRTRSENALLEQLLLGVNQGEETDEHGKSVNTLMDGVNTSLSATSNVNERESKAQNVVKFFVDNEPIQCFDELVDIDYSVEKLSDNSASSIMDDKTSEILLSRVTGSVAAAAGQMRDERLLSNEDPMLYKTSTVNAGSSTVIESPINCVMSDKRQNSAGAIYSGKFCGADAATIGSNNSGFATTSIYNRRLTINRDSKRELSADISQTNSRFASADNASNLDTHLIKLISYDALGSVVSEVVCTTEPDSGGMMSVAGTGGSETSGSVGSGCRGNEPVVYVDVYVESSGSGNDGGSETDDAPETYEEEEEDSNDDDGGSGGAVCNSVLRNLLVHGVDVNYGYQLNHSSVKDSSSRSHTNI